MSERARGRAGGRERDYKAGQEKPRGGCGYGGRQAEAERAVEAMAGFGDGPGAAGPEEEEDEGEVRRGRCVPGRLLERRHRGGAAAAGARSRHQLR